jgi:hypothetical protein
MMILPLSPFPSNPLLSISIQENPIHDSLLLYHYSYNNIIRYSPIISSIVILSLSNRLLIIIPSKYSSDIDDDGELYRIIELIWDGIILSKYLKILYEVIMDE